MKKTRKTILALAVLFGTCIAPMAAYQSLGQELTATEGGGAVEANAKSQKKSGGGFFDIVFGSGIVGTILGLTAAPWALIASAVATLGFDCRIELEKTDGTTVELFSREVGKKAVDFGDAVVDEVKEHFKK